MVCLRRHVRGSEQTSCHDRGDMNAKDWIDAFAGELGTPAPTPDELEALLELAGVAAHSSERVAAPVACWVAAKAGVGPQDAITLARGIAAAE